jgi:GH15 family glucan-1,4-alpha-glucosidase
VPRPVDEATVPTDLELREAGVAIIRAGQAASGAYVACPTYATYGFGWLRDGSFCAAAMDAAGERDSAAAFHAWVARTLIAHADKAERAIARARLGGELPHELLLPTRYTLDGAEEPAEDDAWPNFQLDGYGTWLWAVDRHLEGGSADELAPAIRLAARYLAATWRLPCYDCWEEFGDGEHGSTLASVVAGLDAAARLLADDEIASEAQAVRARLEDALIRGGRLRKGREDDRVDASLLWAIVPFGLLAVDDPRARATAEAVSADLVGPTSGVRRYLGDTFYGGGEWTLLTAWLGWQRVLAGDREGYLECRNWIAATALSPGSELPEQVTTAPQDPSMVEVWVERWGPVATPLLWSHAMWILMTLAAEDAGWS